jgi:hypothetical protein
MRLLLSCLIILLYADVCSAGVFRERNRFNHSADGFWMKGRCVIPVNGLIKDDQRVFRDVGCIVKNRKGKRRPGKRSANVEIISIYWGSINEGGRRIWQSVGARESCRDARRCNSKSFALPLTMDSWRIQGATNCVIGWRSDLSSARSLDIVVGQLPDNIEVEAFREDCRNGNLVRTVTP